MENLSVLRNSGLSEEEAKAVVDTTIKSTHVAVKLVIEHNNQCFQQVNLRLDAMDKKIDTYQQQTDNRLQSLDDKLSRLQYALVIAAISLATIFIGAVTFFRT